MIKMNKMIKFNPFIAFVALQLLAFSNLSANFDLIDSSTAALVNGLSGSQASINLNTIGKRAFNIKYTPSDAQVASLSFSINDTEMSTDTLGSPFYLYRNNEAWLPNPGTYEVRVMGYDASSNLILND